MEQEQSLQKQGTATASNTAGNDVKRTTNTEDLRRSVLRTVGIRSTENSS